MFRGNLCVRSQAAVAEAVRCLLDPTYPWGSLEEDFVSPNPKRRTLLDLLGLSREYITI